MIEFNFSITYFELYFILINIFAFLIYSIDKLQAIKTAKDTTRISEFNLLFVTLIGGSLGSMIAMLAFRHKIKKISFIFKFTIVIIIQVVFIYYMRLK